MEKECKVHGLVSFKEIGIGKNKRLRCSKCNTERVSVRRKKVKRDLVEHFGGKCTICGYNKCIGALTFHHVDPTAKEFGLSDKGMTRSFEKALAEASKCVLVCHNCHSEIHAGLHDLVSTNKST